jgi:ATP-dependent helicase/nuclease subunit B
VENELRRAVTVQLIISPPARGKTRRCAEIVYEHLAQHPMQTCWVVLPAGQHRMAFQRHLGDFGGAMGAQIGTFSSFNHALLARANCLVPVIPNDVLQRLVFSVIDSVYRESGLQYYGSMRAAPGFIAMLRDYFAELKRALVFPEDFLSLFGEDSRLGEIGHLYQAYQVMLQKLDRADPEGVGWLAAETLEKNPDLLCKWKLVVIDGFDSFTPVQKKLLKLVSEQVERLIITLPGDEAKGRVVQRRFIEVQNEIISELDATIEWLNSEHVSLPPAVAYLERHLLSPGSVRADINAGIVLLEARSPAEEAREALRWIKSRVVRSGFSARDCAIAVPDPDVYHAGLKSAADEFGVPLNFTFFPVLSDHPAAAALLDLLNLSAKNYPNRLMYHCIRSPYLGLETWGLTLQTAYSLELVVRYGQVVEGVKQWEEALRKLSLVQDGGVQRQEDTEESPFQLPIGSQAAELWGSLNLFFSDTSPPPGELKLTDWVTWLEDLMIKVNFCTNSENIEDAEALHQIRKALRNLVLGGMITGDEEFTYDQFIVDLTGALESAGGERREEASRDSVIVMRLIEARGVRFRALAVLGLSESIFPQPERADPFFSEVVRRKLKMDPRLGREQAGLFYQAITRADDQLLLMRPYLTENGESWESSPYWNAVTALIPESTVRRIPPDGPRPLEDAASKSELLFFAARRSEVHSAALPRVFQSILVRDMVKLEHNHAVLEARLTSRPGGDYEGYPVSLQSEMNDHYFGDSIWSASRLESYRMCPHIFWVRYALRVEDQPQPVPGLDASQLGLILHEILEKSYQAVENPGNPDEVKAAMRDKAAQEVFSAAPERYGFRPTVLWAIQKEEMMANLDRTIDAFDELAPGWTPTAHELPFGVNSQPALVLAFEEGTIKLRGYVDRVDINALGQLRVVDYKTGSSHLGKQDLIKGRRLQLPLYAMAVQEVSQLGEVIDGFYWSINSGQPGGLVLSRFDGETGSGVAGAIAMARQHIEDILSDVRKVQFPPEPLDGECPRYCPAKNWCWRYSPGR